MKRHHDHSNSYKGKYLIEVQACSFRSLVHYHQGSEHGSLQADMVLEKELRVQGLDPQATGSELSRGYSLITQDLQACIHIN